MNVSVNSVGCKIKISRFSGVLKSLEKIYYISLVQSSFLAASYARNAQMRPIATNVARIVVCSTVCLWDLSTRVSCAKATEPIEMPFRGATHLGPRNHVLAGVQIIHGKSHF